MRNRHVFHSLAVALILGLFGFHAEAQVRSDIRLFSDSFISPSFEATQKTNYQFAGASLVSAPLSEDPVKMDIEGAVAFGAPLLNYLDIKEFYFQIKTADTEKIFVGRKKLVWSELDERWNLGLWQPQFQWNPLSPEAQGLTGIFWQAERSSYAVTLFASPVYVPNQGPSFEVNNGSFVAGNPWFHTPPDSVRIFQESTKVDYTYEKPNEMQVVMHSSYGAKLSVGSLADSFLQLSYLYAPSNELALGYSGLLDTSTLHGQVDLMPQVFYHTVAGLDLSQTLESFRFGISGVYDRPQKDLQFDDKWTYPVFSDASMVSPYIEYARPTYKLTLQSLNVFGGNVTEVGDMASSSRAPLTLRYPFQQAMEVAIENRIFMRKMKRLTSKFSYTLSQQNEFELVQWALNFRWNASWSAFSNLALVRADELTAANQNEIAQYRNHDSLMIGGAYVF